MEPSSSWKLVGGRAPTIGWAKKRCRRMRSGKKAVARDRRPKFPGHGVPAVRARAVHADTTTPRAGCLSQGAVLTALSTCRATRGRGVLMSAAFFYHYNALGLLVYTPTRTKRLNAGSGARQRAEEARSPAGDLTATLAVKASPQFARATIISAFAARGLVGPERGSAALPIFTKTIESAP